MPDTIIKFKDNMSECVAGGHQCDDISKIIGKFMSNLDMDMNGALLAVKAEREAQTVVAGLSGVKMAQSNAPQTVLDVRTAGGLQV